MTTESVAAELEAFVHDYAEEFSTADPSVVADHFNEPAMVVAPGGVRWLADSDDIEALFASILEDLRERGYGRSEADAVDVTPLGSDRALATVDWVRYTTGDDVLERLRTTHLFRRTDDGWKMVVLAPHDE